MPDIYLDVDTALSEVPVNIFPLTDDTDFKTRETAVAYNASGMDLVWNFITSAGAFTQTAVTPTTGGVYDWTHQGDGMYTIEIPASGGASINNDTEGYGWFTGLATGVLSWRGPVIGFRHSAINDSLCDTNNTGMLAPTTAGRTVDVSAGGAVGLDFDNVELSNGQPRIGIFASGTLNGTHSSTTADLGTNAPSVDITGKTLRIPVHGVCVKVDSYNTGTGVATFSPATGATLANSDVWYVDDSPLASTASLPSVVVSSIANNAITAAAIASDAVTEIQSGLATQTSVDDLPTNAELATALAAADDAVLAAIADVPTVAEFEARTPSAAQLVYMVNNAATGLSVTFTTSGGSTTAAVFNQVDGAAPSATNDQYNGRLLVFTDGTLKGVVTDITDYVGSTTTATITAIPTAPTSSHNARLI